MLRWFNKLRSTKISSVLRKVSLLVLLLALLLGTTSLTTLSETDPIKIGAVGPTTGWASAFGSYMVRGIKFALEELDWEIAGRPVKLYTKDTKGEVPILIDKLKELRTREQVDIVIGPCLGSSGLATVDWAKDYPEFPIIIGYSAPEDITMRKALRNVVRAGWTGSQVSFHLGKYVVDEKGWTKIIMIGQDYAFPWGQIAGFERAFNAAGGEEIKKIWHPVGTEDYSSYVLKIRSLAPQYDAVLYNGSGSDAIAFFKQYNEFGLNEMIPIFGFSNFTDFTSLTAMAKAYPDAVKGVVTGMHYAEGLEYAPEGTLSEKTTNNWIDFMTAFKEKHGVRPSAPDGQGYVATQMINKAALAIDGNVENVDAVLNQFYGMKLQAPRGPITIDSYGQPIQNIYIREVQVRDGEFVNVPIKVYHEVTQFGPYEHVRDLYLKQPAISREYPPSDLDKLCPSGLGPYPEEECPGVAPRW